MHFSVVLVPPIYITTLVENEDLNVTLRLLPAAELYIHAEFYVNHPRYDHHL